MTIQQIKQRFGIIGISPLLDRAIDTAIQVAPTDLSVLITGESGTGKEAMPKIIHQLSARKHNTYISVNCGAIPEGTIDSELFGHEKGSFTGAHASRKGYFEEASGGTIFLDEVAELPLQTQVRLLRVLETGEYMKVGSSKILKTDVRIVAATNVDVLRAIQKGKFREDLYYRLNTVPIHIPPLRDRKQDIHLLFRKFASDLAEKYRMPAIQLSPEAVDILQSYRWPGNIRQLKNIAEQISIIEEKRDISGEKLKSYLPDYSEYQHPVIYEDGEKASNMTEREILYKVLFDMRNDISDLKKLMAQVLESDGGDLEDLKKENAQIVRRLYQNKSPRDAERGEKPTLHLPEKTLPGHHETQHEEPIQESEEVEEEEILSLEEKEKELIQKALEKYKGKRKMAARELGISERTLYRKIKEYELN